MPSEETMSRSWGTNFVIISDVLQRLSPEYPGWEHWATIRRGLDEYVLFFHPDYVAPYIEKFERDTVTLVLSAIEDPSEREDIEGFCRAAGLLTRGRDTELKLGYWSEEILGYPK